MRTVKYVGPHEAVTVVLPDGREPVVVRGGALETSDDHAKSLLEQATNWEAIPDTKKAKGEVMGDGD